MGKRKNLIDAIVGLLEWGRDTGVLQEALDEAIDETANEALDWCREHNIPNELLLALLLATGADYDDKETTHEPGGSDAQE
jgi:hypothetical protein